jgi:hypothetical protein
MSNDNQQMYPPGGDHFYTPPPMGDYPGTKLRDPQPPRNAWKIIVPVIIVVVLILAASGAVVFAHLTSKTGNNTTVAVKATALPTQVPTAIPTTPVPAVQATGTVLPDTPTVTATGTVVPTTSVPGSSDNYSAAAPGPGCDTNGGAWTPSSIIDNITCGTSITLSTSQSQGYLYLQLPPGEAFAASNTISINGSSLGNYADSSDCLGLSEQDASQGFLAEYCGNGGWFIYSISNAGAIIKALDSSITSTRQSENLSLTLKGNTLTFMIDTEVHIFNITAIQPTKVAIVGNVAYTGNDISFQNFSYTTPAN